MGINGLLPLLKSIHKPCNLKKFDGKTLGVDAYGWLHRGTVACSMELAMGKPTRRFVDFAMHRVRMLQHFGVTPYLVFDGDYLPSKAATESERSKRREESRKNGLDMLNAGKNSQAYLEFQKAVDVTPEMARQLIDDLKRAGVKYVVAPYEADAQMVYLERKGIIDGILSEDSDLLVFGAKCLLTKLDQYGNCIEINKADFCAVKEISLAGWSDVEFRRMAILSGCDYLASINNMGLKTAYRMVRKHKTIEKIIRMLQFDGKFFVPKNYLDAYQRAELTFLHQRVFCPENLRLVYHTEPDQPLDDTHMSFLGADVEPEIAQGVARGDLNPMTKLPIRSIMVNSSSLFAPSTRNIPQRAASFAETSKKDKDIGSYFKTKRIPLAELDVNCFTPSPTQQDALRRNSGPWSASPTPRPYLNRSLTDVEPHARSMSTPAPSQHRLQQRLPSDRITTETVTPGARPTKRARLCDETDIPISLNQNEEVRSRFFGGQGSHTSASKSRNSKKSKKNDITIFSDDSVEEAMLSIPESSLHGDSGQLLELNVEPAASNSRRLEDSQTQSQSQEQSQESIFSQATSFSTTSSTQPEIPSAPSEPSKSLTAMHNLKERFTAKTTSFPRGTAGYSSPRLSTPDSTMSKPSRIPLAVKPDSVGARKAFTPLQRLGFSAANNLRLPFTPPMTPATPTADGRNKAKHNFMSKGGVPFPEVVDIHARPRGLKSAVEPAMIPLPPVDDTENTALLMENGSEDLIVHDSEEEEPLSPVESLLPKIDLRRFAYSR